MTSISIIVPALNEGENIGKLIEQIAETMFYHKITHEIIVVDDNSDDNTRALVRHLSDRYPLKLLIKKGKPGKAQSLIQGFSQAQYPLVCMMDADLQYTPFAIPSMVERINGGADIVIATRNYTDTPLLRKFMSSTFRSLFGKINHENSVDVLSGLKVFRKEVIERFALHPTAWTFDLEFLKKSVDAGYTIDSLPIDFTERIYGNSKKNLFASAWEIGINALKVTGKRSEAIPFHPKKREIIGNGFNYKGKEYIHYSTLLPHETAFRRFTLSQKGFIVLFLSLIVFGIYLNWHATVVALIAVLTILYFADLLFNLLLVIKSFTKPSEIVIAESEINEVPETDWPNYTVLCPLYKEWKVVPQFVSAMAQLDYPKDKLQVMLLLEANDLETVNAVEEINLPGYFEIVIVPDSFPKTKPKACNYGLLRATGEFAVIYDAEDIPDPLQLKKAVLGFKRSSKRTVCLQAKLNFYNAKQNLLTRIFTAEYSLWFDLVLTGLQSINAPIPLGGTSNHFKTGALRQLKGWDSFNVTEDADLGIRIAKKGYKTAIIDSQTLEEANSNLKNWFAQRSRWIKGYMQTYLVHTRDIQTFLPERRKFNLITFQLVIGGKILSLFINPVMWAITILYFAFRSVTGDFITSFFPTPALYIGIFTLIIGNFLYLYNYMIGCAKHGHHDLIQYVFFVPIYWLTMSVASWIALFQFIHAPHHWAKTKHGLHLKDAVVHKEEITEMGEIEKIEEEISYVDEFPYGQAAFIIYE